MSNTERNYFIGGYQAAKALEKIWRKCGRFACVAHPRGIDFFNTEETSPSEAVQRLAHDYDASYMTVYGWIKNLTVENACFSLN